MLLDEFGNLEECIATANRWRKQYTTEHVSIHTVKFFLDRTNEMGSGASLEPHYNDPDGENYGELNMSKDEFCLLYTSRCV